MTLRRTPSPLSTTTSSTKFRSTSPSPTTSTPVCASPSLRAFGPSSPPSSRRSLPQPLSLPLSGEIGNAIIEYIKYGRPKTEYRNVFVRHISPVQPINSSSLHCMIQRYFTAAHIDIKTRKHGPHALRHSLASNMLLNNTPLPTISQSLGHSSTSSTQIYLKIDTKNLTMCALPLIEEEDSL